MQSTLDLHQPLPAKMLPHTYGYKIKRGSTQVWKDLVRVIGRHDSIPTIEQSIVHLTTTDPSLIKSQAGSGSNSNTDTATQTSPSNLDVKVGGKSSTAAPGYQDSFTWNNCGQVGYIPRNYPNCDSTRMLLKQHLVAKDHPKDRTERPHKPKISGGGHTCRKKSVRHSDKTYCIHGMDNGTGSRLESLSDSYSDMGKGKGGP
jgi:hypothetical protein